MDYSLHKRPAIFRRSLFYRYPSTTNSEVPGCLLGAWPGSFRASMARRVNNPRPLLPQVFASRSAGVCLALNLGEGPNCCRYVRRAEKARPHCWRCCHAGKLSTKGVKEAGDMSEVPSRTRAGTGRALGCSFNEHQVGQHSVRVLDHVMNWQTESKHQQTEHQEHILSSHSLGCTVVRPIARMCMNPSTMSMVMSSSESSWTYITLCPTSWTTSVSVMTMETIRFSHPEERARSLNVRYFCFTG